MSSVLQSFGLQTSSSDVGLARAAPYTGSTYSAGVATKYYLTSATYGLNQPISVSAGGILQPSPSVASTTLPIIGIFAGVQYVDSSGRVQEAPFFNDAFASTTVDPRIIFWITPVGLDLELEIQATGPIAATAIGGLFDFSPTAGLTPGSVTTVGSESGFCTVALNPTEVASGTAGSFRVTGLGREIAYPAGTVANAWGDAFTVVRGVIANGINTVPRNNL